MRHAARHAERLRRDAPRLGLAVPDPGEVERLLHALGAARFRGRAGVVRLAARRGPGGTLLLAGSTRELGDDPGTWSAVLAGEPHPGPGLHGGVKAEAVPVYDHARRDAARAGVDEALLVDRQGRLVEGARSALVLVRADGRVVTPPARRGGVRSLALERVREAVPGLREEDVGREELGSMRELVAVNAVRGARRIVRLGDRALDAGPSTWTARLEAVLTAPCG